MVALVENQYYKQALTEKFASRNKSCRLAQSPGLYQYTRLRDASRYFRLLYVHPETRSVEYSCQELTRCELVTHAIKEAPPFVALSYTWGDPSIRDRIVIGRQVVHVTESLAIAIKHMQHPEKTLIMWADALCINQADETEKGGQVQIMDRIYTQACLVYAWLGAGNDNSTKAMRKIKFYHRAYRHMNKSGKSVSERLGKTPLRRLRLVYSIEPIRSFLERPWFSRIWVFQEAVLNKRLIFGCGTEHLSRDALLTGTLLWHSAGIRLGWPDSPLKTLRIGNYGSLPMTLKDFARSQDSAPFSIANGKLYQCTDSRDFVYGLLGLISDSEMYGLNADYSKTQQQVFTDLAIALVSAGEFTFLQQLWTAPLDPSLPSWVPDLSSTRLRNRLAWRGGKLSRINTKGCPCQKVLSDPYGHALSLEAVELGVVTKVEDSLAVDVTVDQRNAQVSKSRQFLHSVRSSLNDSNTSLTTDRDTMAFQLPLAHCALNGFKAHGSMLASRSGLRRSYDAVLNSSQLDSLHPRQYQYLDLLQSSGLHYLFHLSTGSIGLSQGPAQTGDVFYHLCGTDSRWVLRKQGPGRFRMISPAVVHPEYNRSELQNKKPILLC